MRRGRSLLLLLAVAAGLGAYIFLVESKRDPAAPTEREKIFAIEPGTIEEVEVRAASGEIARLRREAGEWRMVEPAGHPADTAQVGALVSAIERLEAERTIDENPASVEPYGLDPARGSVAFRVAGETTMRRLNLGRRTPTGADLYVQVEGSPKLMLIAAYLEDSLNRTPFDLRDKKVLKFSRDVDALRFEAAGQPAVALTRTNNDWRLTAPVNARADFSGVDSAISRLFQAEMKTIVTEDGAGDLRKYGLDRPRGTATMGSGSGQATIALGGKADDTTIYARDLSRPLIFTVEATVLDEVTKKADDFRSKDVFAFRSFNAMGVDLTFGGRTVTFGKVKPEGGDETAPEEWKQTAPEAKDLDQGRVTDLLSQISNLRAERFTDRAPASPDDLTVVARFGSAASPSEERVTFRRSGDTIHALIPGEPGSAVVATSSYDAALAVLRELLGLQ